jgi:hypothetical protein
MDRDAERHGFADAQPNTNRAYGPNSVSPSRLAGQVPLLSHTVNDAAEEARLLRAGISGIYTDDLLP